MTNREWLNSLDNRQLARLIYFEFIMQGELLMPLEIMEWLKAKHKEQKDGE